MRFFRYSKQNTHNKRLLAVVRKTAFTIFAAAICLSTTNAAKTYVDAAVSIEQDHFSCCGRYQKEKHRTSPITKLYTIIVHFQAYALMMYGWCL